MARVDFYSSEEWRSMARISRYNAKILSDQLTISRRQLERSIRKNFFKSPQKWLNDLRMAEAAGMLEKSRIVKCVAIQLGFKQVSHFSLQFKLRYGLSPRQYLDWTDHQKKSAIKPAMLEPAGEAMLFLSPKAQTTAMSLPDNNVAPG